jgi:hypothetical protein
MSLPAQLVLLGLFLLPADGIAATLAFHARLQSSGPILWYRLDESTGNGINYGSLGASHDATYNGSVERGQPTPGGDSGSRFNGGDDFLESLGASPLTGNPTFSIEGVVLLDTGGVASLWGPFLHWGSGGTGREVYFGIQRNNIDRLYAGFYNAGLRTASTVPTGVFLHAVWVRQGGNTSGTGTTLYINGVPAVLEQDPNLSPGFLAASGINVEATTFRVNRARDFTRFFSGTLDEIALYDRALSPSEVVSHYAAFDGDADGIADDDCPFFASLDQTDTDLDGRGDPCECGDQNGDGQNTVSDLVAINTAIFNPALVTPLCDANHDGLCNVNDIIAVNIEIFSPGNTSTCARQPVPGP